ncbi:helix-turn-helix domain-containing protein [Vibrio sp. 99-70-13A1]|uniref:helix-turn-helix domain-containing protein n=1 Tax=Vibrio sp. 99-70-13A1 TaxID=2607601 RepID=UPI001493A733|nr:AraC family transcriptional regulator [Vibrio sp. 99-70-13A1]
MSGIPSIHFNHQKTNQSEIEFIPLSRLFNFSRLFQTQEKNRNPEENEGLLERKHDSQKPHRISFFLIVFIEEGNGTHMVDFKDYRFSKGSVIFIQREQVHSFDFSSKPKGTAIVFTQAFLDNVHANMRLPNYTPTHLNSSHSALLDLDDKNFVRGRTLIEQTIEELDSDTPEPLIVMYLFSAFALILHRLRPEVRQDKLTHQQSVKFARYFELLQQHYQRVRDANWYAAQVNTTYKTLNQICKTATGMTAKQLIDSFTVLEMKRQMVVNSTTSQQMAYDFGFDDASNFVKYFKNHTFMTPSDFQKRYKTPSIESGL